MLTALALALIAIGLFLGWAGATGQSVRTELAAAFGRSR